MTRPVVEADLDRASQPRARARRAPAIVRVMTASVGGALPGFRLGSSVASSEPNRDGCPAWDERRRRRELGDADFARVVHSISRTAYDAWAAVRERSGMPSRVEIAMRRRARCHRHTGRRSRRTRRHSVPCVYAADARERATERKRSPVPGEGAECEQRIATTTPAGGGFRSVCALSNHRRGRPASRAPPGAVPVEARPVTREQVARSATRVVLTPVKTSVAAPVPARTIAASARLIIPPSASTSRTTEARCSEFGAIEIRICRGFAATRPRSRAAPAMARVRLRAVRCVAHCGDALQDFVGSCAGLRARVSVVTMTSRRGARDAPMSGRLPRSRSPPQRNTTRACRRARRAPRFASTRGVLDRSVGADFSSASGVCAYRPARGLRPPPSVRCASRHGVTFSSARRASSGWLVRRGARASQAGSPLKRPTCPLLSSRQPTASRLRKGAVGNMAGPPDQRDTRRPRSAWEAVRLTPEPITKRRAPGSAPLGLPKASSRFSYSASGRTLKRRRFRAA